MPPYRGVSRSRSRRLTYSRTDDSRRRFGFSPRGRGFPSISPARSRARFASFTVQAVKPPVWASRISRGGTDGGTAARRSSPSSS